MTKIWLYRTGAGWVECEFREGLADYTPMYDPMLGRRVSSVPNAYVQLNRRANKFPEDAASPRYEVVLQLIGDEDGPDGYSQSYGYADDLPSAMAVLKEWGETLLLTERLCGVWGLVTPDLTP
jgi:hypothetical protein